MILVDDKVLFVHVPRTGGVYTTQKLKELGFTTERRGRQHSFLVVPTTYRTISFIRNPYSWYPSFYTRVVNRKEPITKENFIKDFFSIPRYQKMIDRMHKYVDKVYKHSELLESLEEEFGIEFPKEEVNTRLLGTDYTQYYDDETRERVYMRTRSIIDKWGYEFGDP